MYIKLVFLSHSIFLQFGYKMGNSGTCLSFHAATVSLTFFANASALNPKYFLICANGADLPNAGTPNDLCAYLVHPYGLDASKEIQSTPGLITDSLYFKSINSNNSKHGADTTRTLNPSLFFKLNAASNAISTSLPVAISITSHPFSSSPFRTYIPFFTPFADVFFVYLLTRLTFTFCLDKQITLGPFFLANIIFHASTISLPSHGRNVNKLGHARQQGNTSTG